MTAPRPQSPNEVEAIKVSEASRQTEWTRPSGLGLNQIERQKIMKLLVSCDANLIETLKKSP